MRRHVLLPAPLHTCFHSVHKPPSVYIHLCACFQQSVAQLVRFLVFGPNLYFCSLLCDLVPLPGLFNLVLALLYVKLDFCFQLSLS